MLGYRGLTVPDVSVLVWALVNLTVFVTAAGAALLSTACKAPWARRIAQSLTLLLVVTLFVSTVALALDFILGR
jgi:hypothetical protein